MLTLFKVLTSLLLSLVVILSEREQSPYRSHIELTSLLATKDNQQRVNETAT